MRKSPERLAMIGLTIVLAITVLITWQAYQTGTAPKPVSATVLIVVRFAALLLVYIGIQRAFHLRTLAFNDAQEAHRLLLEEREMAIQTLKRGEDRLAEAQRVARLGSYEYDFVTSELVWSEEVFKLFDRNPADGVPPFEEVFATYHPDDHAKLLAAREAGFSSGKPYTCDLRIRQKDGQYKWRRSVTQSMRGADGAVTRIVGTLMDIDESKRAEEKLLELNQAMERATEGIAHIDESGCFTYVNEAYAKMSGYQPEALIGKKWSCTINPETLIAMLDVYEQMRLDGFAFCEAEGQRPDGSRFYKDVRLVRMQDAHGEFAGHYAFARDISQRRWFEDQIEQQILQVNGARLELEEANARLEALATTDGLTGAKNHRAFQESAKEEFERATRYGTAFSLLLLDVDHFKQFNDSFGHPAGDEVLVQVAKILESTVRTCDTVARYGGEEFVIVLPETDLQGALHAGQRIHSELAKANWRHRAVTVSIGASTQTVATTSVAELLEEADKALYSSKRAGRDQTQHFSGVTFAP
jgi:diguanylate cyclase (GGDEF)-like protein/PAS domain S-box-containing protein